MQTNKTQINREALHNAIGYMVLCVTENCKKNETQFRGRIFCDDTPSRKVPKIGYRFIYKIYPLRTLSTPIERGT